MGIKSGLLALHHRLLPVQLEQGYLPYLWLSYLCFLFFPFFWLENLPVISFYATLTLAVVFVAIYFWLYWQQGLRLIIGIVALCLLASTTVLFSSGASVFFVYAGAFVHQLGTTRRAMLALSVILAYVAVFAAVFTLPWYFTAPALFFTAVVGGMNIYQAEIARKNKIIKLSQEELKRMATTAERERIARDLHDLIGHTLSIITVKTQLASKLIDKDIARAKRELQELEKISRQTLSEVREAVSGISKRDLLSELANAKAVLTSSDIDFQSTIDTEIPQGQVNQVLAFALREMATNVIRHSSANECRVRLYAENGNICLAFADNGCGKSIELGNGLSGIKARVEALKGELTVRSNCGLMIDIRVPK